MGVRNWSRGQIVVIVVPLILLVGAVGVALNTGGGSTPDALRVPSQALDAPASVTREPLGIDIKAGHADTVSTLTSGGIPPVALAAYRTAAELLAQADASCNLPWNLVAAIGRVESDHGRVKGRTLGDDGSVTPPLFGPAVRDGQFKGARPAGPFQFVPALWTSVGVDVDGDGRKDPHDVDDAATAAAVYLCAGDGDLSTSPGVTEALERYNPSQRYGAIVAEISDIYAAGTWDDGAAQVPESVMVQAVARDQALARETPTARRDKPARPAEEPRGDRQPAPTKTSATPKPAKPVPTTKPTQPPSTPKPTPTPTSDHGSSGGVSDLVEGVGEDLGEGNLDSTLTWAEA
jgi:hypothetical protein